MTNLSFELGSMGSIILKDNVWEKITELSNSSKRTNVAVAYLGKGATKLLRLKKGDNLVIDMSQGIVSRGETNPFEVEKYLKKGVNVFTYSNLHAKVYVFDKTLVIGSANVSSNSKDNLKEACLLCTNSNIITDARKMIKDLQLERVTPEYINFCKKIYRPPHFGKKSYNQSNLWLVGVWPLNKMKEEEEKLNNSERERASGKIRNKQKYETNLIRWNGNSSLGKNIQVGDLIIQIQNEEKNKRVYPPFRVVHLKRYNTFDSSKKPRIFIYVEEPRKTKTFEWQLFQKELHNMGLINKKSEMCMRIKSGDSKNKILRLLSK